MHSNNRAPASANLLHKTVMIINDGDGGDGGGGGGDGEPLLLHRICQVIHDITSINRDPKSLQFKRLGQTLF